MFQSRDEARQVYLNVWHKIQRKQLLEPMEAIIAEVIEIHPEYHPLLQDGDGLEQQEFTRNRDKQIHFFTWECISHCASRRIPIVLPELDLYTRN